MIQSPPALLNLSDLSGRVDVQGFYESHGCVTTGKPTNSRREGKEWSCSCFVCGGTDRASFWESGRFCCVRGCRAKASSPYWFLRDIQGYSHQQSLQELGIDQSEIAFGSVDKVILPLEFIRDEPPCQKWQEQAHLMCHVWEKVLWSSQGQSARDYLHSRGFKDETIKQAHLGLNSDWYKSSLEDWGLDASQLNKEDDPRILIPRGIVLPWRIDRDSIWKIQLRRPAPGPDGKTYKEITGSSNLLYNVDSIQSDKPVMLVESELDALSVHQEASDLVACCATGGSGKALSGRPIARLNHASFLLQSFDDDEAGDSGAERWLDAFELSERWTPWAHDCNDMLKNEPGSIRRWVQQALNMIAVQGEEVEPQPIAPPALYDLAGKEIPAELIATFPNLVERLAVFQQGSLAGRKMCCNTLDWVIDGESIVCPCVLKLREENRLLDLRIAQEQARKRSSLAFSDW